MLTVFGIVLVIALMLVRPQELIADLHGVPLLYGALALTSIGAIADVLTQKTTLRRTPVTLWALGFIAWCFVTLGIDSPDFGWVGIQRMVICIVLCLVVAHSVQTPRALNVVAGTVMACAVLLAGLGLHQGLSPRQCVARDNTGGVQEEGEVDGRHCSDEDECYNRWGARPGMAYSCEGIGVYGTTSIDNGRVRWVGVLHDPNDLALAIGCAIPIAFAMRREKRVPSRTLLAILAAILIIACVILTRSRGGQLVLLAVFGTYFLVRSGIRGVVVASILTVPALFYGGRAGAAAYSSTVTRLECWYEGVQMLRNNPVFGVGHGMFTERYWQTAHNSYLLAAAENGIFGLTLFVGALYSASKISWVALGRYDDPDDPRRAWAIGLLASLAGMAVGAFFLSFTYHPVLWLYVGLAGAYYSVVKKADAGFEVPWGARDYLRIFAISGGLMIALYVATRFFK
jgi:hypothetical protein